MFGPVDGMHLTYMWHVHDFGYPNLEGRDAGDRRITIEPWTMKVTGWLDQPLTVVIEGRVIKANGERGRTNRQHIYRDHDHGRWGVQPFEDLPDWAKPRLEEARAKHVSADTGSES